MAEPKSKLAAISDGDYWNKWLDTLVDWTYNTLASTETLIELAVISLAAVLTWPIARYLRQQLNKLKIDKPKESLLGRLWSTAGRIAFPMTWVIALWISELVMASLEIRHGLLVIIASTSSNGPFSKRPISAGPISAGPISKGPISAGPISKEPISAGPISE